MRRGFTMIELIFVIVILGILAAVAIPRLAATRDDAEVSKACSNAATLISDFGSYYTSQGAFGGVEDMTNVVTDAASNVNFGTGATANIEAKQQDCVTVTSTATGAADGNITITVASTPAICGQVDDACGKIAKTYQFGGSGIKR